MYIKIDKADIILGSGRSTVVEKAPVNQEVKGLNFAPS